MGALWTGVTGLNTYSQGMGVVGNNLANVNTVGYKKTDILYDDLIYAAAGGGTSGQIGKGVQVYSLEVNTGVGGLESTNENTDIAINGENGFFMVKDADENTFYTRAGNFRFDKSGNLVDPLGNVLQGWEVDQAAYQAAKRSGESGGEVPTTGSLTDIQIENMEIPALSTANVSMVVNLDSEATANARDAADPYFTTFKSYAYDANNASSVPVSNANYSSTIKVYDSNGDSHDLTVYYSKVENNGGKDIWEYLVSLDPAEDGRSAVAGTDKAGVVMIGTITFDSSGVMENTTAYTLSSNATDPTSLSSWTRSAFSTNGYPEFNMTFAAASNGGSTTSSTISLEMGLKSASKSWSSTMPSSASGVGTDVANTNGLTLSDAKTTFYASTNYASSSYTLTSSQDGYPSGTLENVSVDGDGVLSGYFSNGRTEPLFVIGLADFTNEADLRREGNNLFSATALSGKATTGRANSGVFSSIAGKSLENSNVDMAEEMVNMILTQRAFQSNSKVVTTADAMMQKALELKR